MQLESRLLSELSRVESEAQAAARAVSQELGKVKKEREAAWRHVSELKEQNCAMRQRTFELEQQNCHLHRTVVLLQEQLELIKDERQAMHAHAQHAAACGGGGHPLDENGHPLTHHGHGPCGMPGVMQEQSMGVRMPLGVLNGPPMSPLMDKMPKVPHTGAEIW